VVVNGAKGIVVLDVVNNVITHVEALERPDVAALLQGRESQLASSPGPSRAPASHWISTKSPRCQLPAAITSRIPAVSAPRVSPPAPQNSTVTVAVIAHAHPR
jgi:hypothetical protein